MMRFLNRLFRCVVAPKTFGEVDQSANITIARPHYEMLVQRHIDLIRLEDDKSFLLEELAKIVIPAYVDQHFGTECPEYEQGCARCKAHQAKRFLLDAWSEEFANEITDEVTR